MKGFSNIAGPLNHLLQHVKWNWTAEQQKAFEELKQCRVQVPVVAYPDFTLLFVVYMDTSDYGLGAVLMQKQNGRDITVACPGHSLNESEKNYSTTKKECFTVVWALHHFRSYLLTQPFKVYTTNL